MSTPEGIGLPAEHVNTAIRKKICLKYGHQFKEIDDTDHREEQGKDTWVRRSFICHACGEVINPVVSIWYDWKSRKR